MIRDCIKNKLYFDCFIEKFIKNIEKNKKEILLGQIQLERVPTMQAVLLKRAFELWIARYSRGDDIEKLVNNYIELVKEMELYWNYNRYQDMLWMMSIGVMLDIDNNIFDILAQLVEKNKVKDYVLQYLIDNKLGKSQMYSEYPILFERRLVKNLIEPDFNTASKNIKKFLNSWYGCNHSCAWYDRHKSDDYLYSGYWSFECGAIAKIRGLEDSNMKGAQYYPYDLVHYTDSLK